MAEEEKTTIDELLDDEQFKEAWEHANDETKVKVKEIIDGERVPNILGDRIFKGVFDPKVNTSRLSGLISAVLGRKTTVIEGLDKEGIYISKNSKSILLDIIVKFENGEFAIVEVQRKGSDMPPQRNVIYSVDILKRQYAIEPGQKMSDIDYGSIRPVYTIVLMEKSTKLFKDTGEYHHHFRQVSDTGIESGDEFELLQYYDYLCLDMFESSKPHVASELVKWMDFLTIKKNDEMERFVSENPEFEDVYRKVMDMTKTKHDICAEVIALMDSEDVIGSINRTNASKVKRLEREIAQVVQERDQVVQERDQVVQEKDQLAQEKAQVVQERDQLAQEIAELRAMLSKTGQ